MEDNAYRWHEDNAKKRGRKEEAELMKEAHKRNEVREYQNVGGTFLN